MLTTQQPDSDGQRVVVVSDPEGVAACLVSTGCRPSMRRAEDFVGKVEAPTPMLLSLEGEEHARRRRAVAGLFSVAAVSAWHDIARDHCRRLLAGLHGDEIVLGEVVTRPVAEAMALEWLGLPLRHQATEASELLLLARGVFDTSMSQRRRQLPSVYLERALRRLINGQVARQKERTLLGNCPSISSDDATGAAMSLLTVGIELGARAMLTMLHEGAPRDWGRITVLDDRGLDGLIGAGAIIATTERVVTIPDALPTTLRGCYGGDTLRLDLTQRSESSALTFGLGAHYCLGAPWVRMLCRALIQTVDELGLRLQVVNVVPSCEGPSGFGGVVELVACVDDGWDACV